MAIDGGISGAIGKLAESVKVLSDQVEADRARAAAEQATWLNPSQVERILREFLETWPLYRRLTFKSFTPTRDVSFPRALSMPCAHPACKDEPTTTWKAEQGHGARPGEIQIYQCVHCGRAEISFWLMSEFADEVNPPPHAPVRDSLPAYRKITVFKVGQVPGWNISPPKAVERALDAEDLELYKRGLISMSQSYGIGALGYFRRVVENGVDALLDLVEEAANADNDAAAVESLKEARRQKNAEQKLHLASQRVPASLRPGGVNPLGVLYSNYSRGLHQETDDECLAIATELRDALEYVFGNMREQFEQAKAFRAKITKRAGGS